MLRKIIITFFAIIPHLLTDAQEFRNEAGEREKHFVYQVKQIDEFFERFNNDPGSFIRDVYNSYNTKFQVDRKKLIKSLFNYDKKSWNAAIMDAFVDKALEVKMPTSKNWYGENWYAEANCKFEYNNATIDIPIVLRVSTDEMKRSKWVISGVKLSGIKESDIINSRATINRKNTKFINPASHGNNFIELQKALDDKENLADYFDNAFFSKSSGNIFYNLLLLGKIKLIAVGQLKYHFLNVDRHIFSAEYFQRQGLNSGWLINNLKVATASEKELYKRVLLGS